MINFYSLIIFFYIETDHRLKLPQYARPVAKYLMLNTCFYRTEYLPYT